MRKNIIVRWDDVYPKMDRKKFERIVNMFKTYNVPAVLGVIPKYKKFRHQNEQSYSEKEFYTFLRKLQKEGWEIALHGYEHVKRGGGGILKINKIGEFGDLSFEEQTEMISRGKAILEEQGLEIKSFIAPWHSYNLNTFKALKANNIKILSDGLFKYPVKKNGVWQLPQQQVFRIPYVPKEGFYTICIHPNTLKECHFASLERFLRKNKRRITTFNKLTLKKTKVSHYAFNFFSHIFHRLRIKIF